MATKTIKLKKYSDVIEEYTATASKITPGMLLELASATTVKAHATAEGNVLPMFALEDELQGKGIDEEYAVSVKIQCWITNRGDQVYAIIEDETSISAGDFLASNGAGLLQKHIPETESWAEPSAKGSVTVYPNTIVAVALEAVAMAAASSLNSSISPLGVARRIKVRII